MNVAVLGATGAVGRTMLAVLAERGVPVDGLTLLASARSAGTRIEWGGAEHTVRAPEPGVFRGVDVALFSAGAERSREWATRAADEGAVVIDNSSAWRMDPDVPLLVPEVNAHALAERPRGIIANPNCSTIQAVVALAPLHRAVGLRRVLYTTFQSVSGAGEKGRGALRQELNGGRAEGSPFTRPIAGNVVAQIGGFGPNGFTGEEEKMRGETRKILDAPDLPVVATCVRVPVDLGHAVQVTLELNRPLALSEAVDVLTGAPGVVVAEAPEAFPSPREIAGRDEVFVGRIRVDPDFAETLHLWVVADNLRKGAATNAVQILELLARG